MDGRTPTGVEAATQAATRIDSERGSASLPRHAWACLWWSVRAHLADVHLLPRDQALEPPPAPWLKASPARKPGARPPLRRRV